MIAVEWLGPDWEDNLLVWKETYRDEHRYCEAQEGSYFHEAQHWELLPEDGATAEHLLGHARALAASLWLCILPTLALGLLVH